MHKIVSNLLCYLCALVCGEVITVVDMKDIRLIAGMFGILLECIEITKINVIRNMKYLFHSKDYY